MGKGHKLENVAIRMVKAPPLYSSEPLKTPMDVVRVLGKELEAYDREVLCVVNFVATHLSCPKINQIDCHRMSRYNGISLKKGKVPGHLQFRHR